MKVALFCGSFDPPHLGHVSAAEVVSEEIAPDKFLIVPAYINPRYRETPEITLPEIRLELCRLAFRDIPNVEVCDVEVKRGGISYVANTVEDIRQGIPEAEIHLVVGSNSFLKSDTWDRMDVILRECILTVLAMDNDDIVEIKEHARWLENECSARTEVFYHDPKPIHSRNLRERLRKRLGADQLPEDVYGEIIRRRLYGAKPELSWLRNKAFRYLASDRVEHVAGVEYEAVALSMRYGEDPEDAAEAAILHDITKALSFDEQLQMIEKYGIICESEELKNPPILHAKTGAAFSADLFGVPERICDAIRWHTTGKPDMTMLEKIIYMADYIEPTRNFEGVEEVRETTEKDLDEGLAMALKNTVDHLRSKGIEPFIDTVKAYNWYNTKECN